MQYEKLKSGTILIYTMVLVVLGVFMATVVLNIATQLSLEYDKRNIEISIMNIVKTKGDLAMKYGKRVNESGSGFIDILSCPENISLSGSINIDTDIDTNIRFLTGSVMCVGNHNNGNELILAFNNTYSDLHFAQYNGRQIAINSGSLSGNFGDSDNSFLDLGSTSYFNPDGIDDNFDSDNYTIFSTGSSIYPDGFVDNDADARVLTYGYVIENSGLYNAFWSNTKMKNYINENSNNVGSEYTRLGDVSSGILHLDINSDHRMILYRLDSNSYDETNELIINQTITGTGQLGGVGYLQNDLSIGTGSTNAYNFDFTAYDYSLFVENTGSGTLLYQIRGEDSVSGSGIYLTPIQDDDVSLLSFLGSHMFVDEEGRLIADQFEIFGLK